MEEVSPIFLGSHYALAHEDFNPFLPTGKVIREGMGQATGRPDSETLDLVITNALIVDWSGIYKVIISLLLSIDTSVILTVLFSLSVG